MATYGYVRVSTKIQADEGLSLDAQSRQISGYAMMRGLDIDAIYAERAVSGWKPIEKRPEGQRLMSVLKYGDSIVCPKLDRMFRSAKDALTVSEALRKKGVSLHLLDLGGDVTGNGIGKMFFTIVAAFAEFEHDRIAERITDVKVTEKAKRRYLGGACPLGYQIDENGFLVPNEQEQTLLGRIASLHEEGKSLRDIARAVSSPERAISHVVVQRVLRDGRSRC